MAGGDFRSQGVIGSGVFPQPAGAQPGDVFVAVTNINLLALGFPGPGWVQHGSVDQLGVFSKQVVGDEPAFLASGIPATARGVVACYEACAVEAVSLYQSSGRAAPHDQTTLKGLAAHPYSSGQRFVAGVLLSSNQSIPTVADPGGFAARYTAGVIDPQASDRTTALALTDRSVSPGATVPTQTLAVDPGSKGTIQSKLSVALLLRPHNSPPYSPLLATPPAGAALDQGQTNRFTWEFADPDDGDVQSRYELQIRSTATGAAWTTTGPVDSPSSLRDYGPGDLGVGSFEWRVRVWDRYAFDGPWSPPRPFSVAAQPVGPVIVSPANGETITEPWADLVWSVPEQDATQYRVLDDNADGTADTTNVIFDSGELTPAAYRTARVPLPDNNTIRHLQVRSKAAGLWSVRASVRVPVAFTPPPEPLVVIDEDVPKGAITISGTIRPPLGAQPAVVSVEVWRRDVGDDGAGVPVATITPSGSHVDWAFASDVDYEYRLLATASTGAMIWSQWRRSKDLTGLNRAYGNLGDFLDADSVLLWEADNATLEWTDTQGIGDPGALKIVTTTGGLPVMVRPIDPWDAVFGVTYTTIVQVRDGGQRRLIRLRRRWFGEAGQLLREDLGVPVEETAAASTGAPEVDVSYQLRVATSPTRSPSDPLAGAALTQPVAVFVEPATGVTSVEWSVDDAVTSVDTSAPFDLAGGSDTSAVLYDPAALPPGPHTIKAVITLASGAFRTLIGSVTRPALPNMVVEAVTWSPQNPTPGQTVTFSVVVRNDGVGPKPAGIPTGVPLKVDGVTVGYDDQHVAAIPPGASVTIPLTTYLPAPSTGWSSTAGTHQVTTRVNDVRRYEETAYDEAYSATLVVTGVVTSPGTIPSDATGTQASPAERPARLPGADTHMNYDSYGEDVVNNPNLDPALGAMMVADKILELGARHVREVPDPSSEQALRYLGENGVRLFLSVAHGSATPATLPGFMEGRRAMFERLAPYTDAICGVNEADNRPSTTAEMRSMMQITWDRVKSNPALAHIPVVSIPMVNPGYPAVQGLGDIAPIVQGISAHPYPGGRQPSYKSASEDIAFMRNLIVSKPSVVFSPTDYDYMDGSDVFAIFTETGYHNNISSVDHGHRGTPRDVAAAYAPIMCAYYDQIGVARAQFYEFLNQSTNKGGETTTATWEGSFGLVEQNLTPKLIFHALRNFISLLGDKGPAFTPGKLNCTVAGNAATRHRLYQKRDGRFFLAIWQDVSLWNRDNYTRLYPADVPVTVTLGSRAATMRTFVPYRLGGPTTMTPSAPVNIAQGAAYGLTSNAHLSVVEITP